jgi:Zn-dependent protease
MKIIRRKFSLGKIGGLEIYARVSAFVGAAILAVVFIVMAMSALAMPLLEAIVWGVAAVIVHYVTYYLHHLGHALAARRTGHPMSGILFSWFLGRSLYPRDEGELPANVHIQRALGGPIFSGVIGLISGAAAVALSSTSGFIYYLTAFFALENLLGGTLGALLPVRFLDGGTILYWLPRR